MDVQDLKTLALFGRIFAGYNKCIRVFDLHRPGRDFKLYSTVKDNKEGQTGNISNCSCWREYFGGNGFKQKSIWRKALKQSDVDNQSINAGIISAMAFSPSNTGMLAMGSYSQTTAIYREDNMELLYVLHGQEGGITHVSQLYL